MQAYTQAKKDLIHLSYIFHLLPHTHTTCIKTETCKLMFKGMQSLSEPTQHCKGKKKHTSCIILSLRGEKGQRHPMTVKLLMKLCQGFSWLSLVKKEKERKKRRRINAKDGYWQQSHLWVRAAAKTPGHKDDDIKGKKMKIEGHRWALAVFICCKITSFTISKADRSHSSISV